MRLGGAQGLEFGEVGPVCVTHRRWVIAGESFVVIVPWAQFFGSHVAYLALEVLLSRLVSLCDELTPIWGRASGRDGKRLRGATAQTRGDTVTLRPAAQRLRAFRAFFGVFRVSEHRFNPRI